MPINEIVTMALWALGATVCLVAMFQNIRIRWPENYFGAIESPSHLISRSPFRYLAFRFLPLLAVFTIVAAFSASPVLTTRISWICYMTVSAALSISSSLQRKPNAPTLTRPRQAVLAIIAVLTGIAGELAIPLGSLLRSNTPDWSSIISDIMAAFVASLVVIVYLQLSRNDLVPPHESRSIPRNVVTQIKAIALENSVDPQLAIAIAYVEDTQRPLWVRRIENATYIFNRQGSYGLFQVKGHGRISDIESCRIAMSRIRGSFPLLDEYGNAAHWSIVWMAEKHNPERDFAQYVAESYRQFPQYSLNETTIKAPDNRPLIQIMMVGRFGSQMRVRGTAFDSGNVTILVHTIDSSRRISGIIDATIIAVRPGRISWFADIDVETSEVKVVVQEPDDDCMTEQSLSLFLADTTVERDLTLNPRQE